MLKSLLNIFRKQPLYRIVTNTKELCEKDTDLLKDLLSKKVQALVVRDFVSPQKCADIIQSLDKLNAGLRKEIPFGVLYGKTLVGSAQNMPDYFYQAEHLNRQMPEMTGLNILQELNRFFKKVIQIKPVSLQGQEYTNGTVRVFSPGKGGLHAHAEAEFVSSLAEFEDIRHQIDMSTQINYLVILQAADSGGELVLYDLNWTNTPDELKEGNAFYDHYAQRESIIQKYAQQNVTLKTGDLLLFNGIEIWHAVREIYGNNNRVTFAGFIAKKKDGGDYVIYN
jgi:hypothetical protein